MIIWGRREPWTIMEHRVKLSDNRFSLYAWFAKKIPPCFTYVLLPIFVVDTCPLYAAANLPIPN